MKRVIKFLFPKTYQAIYDKGYYQCMFDVNNIHDNPECYEHDIYDHPEYYDDAYYEQEELERLSAEHYAQLAEQELLEEWEEECRKEERALAEIYLPKAPDLQVGDKIHLHSKQGMYTVVEVYTDSFAYNTAHSDISYADYEDYKCHAGGMWKLRRGN